MLELGSETVKLTLQNPQAWTRHRQVINMRMRLRFALIVAAALQTRFAGADMQISHFICIQLCV